ncbi:MFS transporter [Agromyces sp. Leaf222]|uniref:MFS transporter n=1 Tax=Agromyces sp. Leaf222 TaxID=1735688 RepID=UPI000701DAD7|nr:MFS transporter [Agromyces sp. Leaf222]KQM83555.1 MFS transporter [Agromyces sp. Leaf222]
MTNTRQATQPVAARTAGFWQAVLLLAGSCMPVLGSVLITPILPQLSEVFGDQPGSEVLVPMIVAIPALIIAIFAPFAGQIVDRLGRKNLLLVTMFAYALVGTAPAWLEDLQLILFSRVLVGVCEAAIMTVCTTLIVDYFHEEKRRTRYLGLQTVVTTLAATVFIVVGGALGVAGWHTPFWVYAISLVIAVPMIFLLWEPSRDDRTDAHVSTGEKVRVPWRLLAAPLVVTLFGGFTFYVIIIEASYLVVGTGVAATDTATIGLVAALASLATAAGAFTFARIAKLQPRVQLPVAFGLQAIGMLVIWLGGGLPAVIVGAIIASAGSGLLLPTLVTWALSKIAFEERGRSTGWWQTSFYLGQFLTPIIMGGIAAAVGGLSVAVGVVGIAAAIVAILLGVLLRRRVATGEPASA